jgi:hypothetical protein
VDPITGKPLTIQPYKSSNPNGTSKFSFNDVQVTGYLDSDGTLHNTPNQQDPNDPIGNKINVYKANPNASYDANIIQHDVD